MHADLYSVWINIVIDFDMDACKLVLNNLKLYKIEYGKKRCFAGNCLKYLATPPDLFAS